MTILSKPTQSDDEMINEYILNFMKDFYRYQNEIQITGRMCIFNSYYINNKLQEYGLNTKIKHGMAIHQKGKGLMPINHTWVSYEDQILEPNYDLIKKGNVTYYNFQDAMILLREMKLKGTEKVEQDIKKHHKGMIIFLKDPTDVHQIIKKYISLLHSRRGTIMEGMIIKNIFKSSRK